MNPNASNPAQIDPGSTIVTQPIPMPPNDKQNDPGAFYRTDPKLEKARLSAELAADALDRLAKDLISCRVPELADKAAQALEASEHLRQWRKTMTEYA